MALKTNSEDAEAAAISKQRKRPEDPPSEVVGERLDSAVSAHDLANRAGAIRVEPRALDAIDRVVARRPKSPARSPKL